MTTQTVSTNGQPKKPEFRVVSDYVETGIIATYIIQKMGQPTLKEIQKVALEKLNCKLDGRVLQRALRGNARSGRSIVSILQQRLPEDQGGVIVDVFSMRDPQRWRTAPEYAQFVDFLPNLTSTPQLQDIKNAFDKSETAPVGKSAKGQRGNQIDDYKHYSVLIYTLDPLLGSQIHCPYTDLARGETPKHVDKNDKPEMEGIFVVDKLTGERVIPNDCLTGWFNTNASRFGGLSPSKADYLAFKPLRIPASVKPIQLMLPVVNSQNGKPSAPKSYEAIPPGQILRIEFTAPTKGVFTTPQYEKLFHLIGDRPRRGLSPARGKRYGRFTVLDFREQGDLKTSGIDFVLQNLPEELLQKHGKKKDVLPTKVTDEHVKYIVEATERLRNVEIKTGDKEASEEVSSENEEDSDDE